MCDIAYYVVCFVCFVCLASSPSVLPQFWLGGQYIDITYIAQDRHRMNQTG